MSFLCQVLKCTSFWCLYQGCRLAGSSRPLRSTMVASHSLYSRGSEIGVASASRRASTRLSLARQETGSRACASPPRFSECTAAAAVELATSHPNTTIPMPVASRTSAIAMATYPSAVVRRHTGRIAAMAGKKTRRGALPSAVSRLPHALGCSVPNIHGAAVAARPASWQVRREGRSNLRRVRISSDTKVPARGRTFRRRVLPTCESNQASLPNRWESSRRGYPIAGIWMKHQYIHVVKEHVVKEQVVGTASLLKKEPQQNNHGRRGANAPLREEILSTPAPSSVIARRRQGDEAPSTGDTRDATDGCCATFMLAAGISTPRWFPRPPRLVRSSPLLRFVVFPLSFVKGKHSKPSKEEEHVRKAHTQRNNPSRACGLRS